MALFLTAYDCDHKVLIVIYLLHVLFLLTVCCHIRVPRLGFEPAPHGWTWLPCLVNKRHYMMHNTQYFILFISIPLTSKPSSLSAHLYCTVVYPLFKLNKTVMRVSWYIVEPTYILPEDSAIWKWLRITYHKSLIIIIVLIWNAS